MGVAEVGAAILSVGICMREVHMLACRAIISTGFVIGLLLGQGNMFEGERMHRTTYLVGTVLRLLVLFLFVDTQNLMLVVGPTATDCARYAGEYSGGAIMLFELLLCREMRHAQRWVRSSWWGRRDGNRG
jgi:hypothetical protein